MSLIWKSECLKSFDDCSIYLLQVPSMAHHPLAGIPGALTAPMNLSKPSKEQILQHHNLLQAHQAQLRAGGPLALQVCIILSN